MANFRRGALATARAALCAVAFLLLLSISRAHADPPPDTCRPAPGGDNNACAARLSSVTANTTDGTITGTPVGGAAPMTLWGQADAYLKSQGFGDTPPDPVQRWDAAIDGVTHAEPSDPNWYGNAKSRAFLPRTLNGLASQFPPGILVVRFMPDDTHAGWFRLVSIQPVAQ
ncbi:hypothetical protein A5781_15100 [Mycobacterium sp. 852002-30065_SCH5024008]|nr:hypothetical protein A5781_15100 [Mycobacterium sp. 852002-30065_SCH5024008]